MVDSEAVFRTFSLVIKKRKAFININVKDYECELPTAVKWFIVYIQYNYRIRKNKQHIYWEYCCARAKRSNSEFGYC